MVSHAWKYGVGSLTGPGCGGVIQPSSKEEGYAHAYYSAGDGGRRGGDGG